MAGPRRVREPERLHLVLQVVAGGPRAPARGPGPGPPTRTARCLEVLNALVVVLVGLLLAHVLGADCLAEGEVAFSGVDVVVVVDCGGADALV